MLQYYIPMLQLFLLLMSVDGQLFISAADHLHLLSIDDLHRYEHHLQQLIDAVQQQIRATSSTVAVVAAASVQRRSLPISSSLSDRNSPFIRKRIFDLTSSMAVTTTPNHPSTSNVTTTRTNTTTTTTSGTMTTTTTATSTSTTIADGSVTTNETTTTITTTTTNTTMTSPSTTQQPTTTLSSSINESSTFQPTTNTTIAINSTSTATTFLPNSTTDQLLVNITANSTISLSATEDVSSNDNDIFSSRRLKQPRIRNKSVGSGSGGGIDCRRLSQSELVIELKQKGTYNPDFMAWDVSGVIRFLDNTIVGHYDDKVRCKYDNTCVDYQPKQTNTTSTNASSIAVEKNLNALEKILDELNVHCDVRSPDAIARLYNLTSSNVRRPLISPSIRHTDSDDQMRPKRSTAEMMTQKLINDLLLFDDLNQTTNDEHLHVLRDQPIYDDGSVPKKRQKLIGQVHIVPFGCDKRGSEEDGYLRLCGACQAIRRLPNSFFPPFINEIICDQDRACLYFYDYPHGKCKQKHMNFVVLRNIGTHECQIWRKFNLNVRVSCECFVDEMSFFAKYV